MQVSTFGWNPSYVSCHVLVFHLWPPKCQAKCTAFEVQMLLSRFWQWYQVAVQSILWDSTLFKCCIWYISVFERLPLSSFWMSLGPGTGFWVFLKHFLYQLWHLIYSFSKYVSSSSVKPCALILRSSIGAVRQFPQVLKSYWPNQCPKIWVLFFHCRMKECYFIM